MAGLTPRPPELPEGWTVTTVAYGGTRFAEAEELELEVFAQEGYSASSSQRCEEYDPWRFVSRFHLALNTRGEIRGLVRVVAGPYGSLPVARLRTFSLMPDVETVEYASLVVVPDARGSGVAESLYLAVYLDALRNGARQFAGIVDPWLFELLRDTYGFPFEAVGAPTWYMVGDVIPIVVSLQRVHRELAERQPNIANWLFSALTDNEIQKHGVALPPSFSNA